MQTIHIAPRWSPWKEEARLAAGGCPEACRAAVLAALRDDDRTESTAIMVSDRVALAFVLWASAIPGWSKGPPQAPTLAAVLEEVLDADDPRDVPFPVRVAIGLLCDGYDVDEIGQVDQHDIDNLRRYRA